MNETLLRDHADFIAEDGFIVFLFEPEAKLMSFGTEQERTESNFRALDFIDRDNAISYPDTSFNRFDNNKNWYEQDY